MRKGTRCCWKCKRRKIRHVFEFPDNAIRSSFQRPCTPSVSQDKPEDMSPAKKGNRYLGDSIAKVEDSMKNVLASKCVEVAQQIGENFRRHRAQSDSTDLVSSRGGPPTPSDVCVPILYAWMRANSLPQEERGVPSQQFSSLFWADAFE